MIELANEESKKVDVEFDLSDIDILRLALEAHKRDITINKMVELILQEVIDNHSVNETPE